MNICESCGKEFASDDEFKIHQNLEEAKKMSKKTSHELNWVASVILGMNILAVQRRDHCDILTATKTFWEETTIINQTWNRMHRERDGSLDGPVDGGVC